jgi:hypothetical protein
VRVRGAALRRIRMEVVRVVGERGDLEAIAVEDPTNHADIELRHVDV